ncbi:MAG TPA: CBS domain-containing protein [Peptococcaceae bacterium]|nr:CBS domain-containing protein [Peptococcaceae bacterium]
MQVKDIMTTDVNFVTTTTTIPDIARVMKQKDIGSVPVLQNNKVVGIITDRDIVLRVLAENKDYNKVTAGEIMTADPVCINEKEDVDTAAEMMAEYQVKRLPVLSKGNLVGMLSLGDLAIEQIHVDEASNALSGISRGINH